MTGASSTWIYLNNKKIPTINEIDLPEKEIVLVNSKSEDIHCLAKNLYFESANQPDIGKIAVGLVVLNRVSHSSYPDSICDVITQGPTYTNWKGTILPVKHKCQFSWYCDGISDDPIDSYTWQHCIHLAEMLLYNDMYDFTEGSTHYHATSVDPYWNKSLDKVVQIEDHIFYR